MVRSRKTTREIILWMEENLITLHGNKFAAEVVVHTLLEIGSKSFTHLITVMERYGQVIAKLASDVGMQVLVINEVTSFLKNNTQMIAIAIDRMMGYRLVSNLAIVTWVFSEVNVNQFHLSDRPWEILQNAINKTYNRISNLRKKIRSLEKGILLAQKTSMKAQKEYEAVELKFEIVDGQLVQAENPRRLKRLKGYADRAKHEETGRESLNAKEALLARALEENMELFISLYKRIRFVFMECFPSFSPDGKLPSLRGGQMDIMIVDLKKLLNMDVDDEKGNTNNSNMSDSERAANAYKIEELEQWCLTIMGSGLTWRSWMQNSLITKSIHFSGQRYMKV